MPTSLVTGGAGFLGSHLCEALLERGHRVICVDNLVVSTLENIDHLRDDAFTFVNHDVIEPIVVRGAGRLRLPPGCAREPGRLPAPAAALAQDGLVRHAPRARAREVEARAVPARVDERGVRRSGGAPAARDVLGQREPDRPARRLRRGEALRRGADHGVPPPAGREHGDRADLQHLRAADARERRSRDPDLPPPGARGQAGHRVRRRLADAELLLRGRPDSRDRPARGVGRAPAREPRQSGREDAARARGDRSSGSPARRARSCTRRCPWTIRRCGSRTSRARSRFSAGSRRSPSRTACARRSPRSATRPPSAPREQLAYSANATKSTIGNAATRATSSSSPSGSRCSSAAIGRGKRVLDLGCRSGALTPALPRGKLGRRARRRRRCAREGCGARDRAGAGERRGAAPVRGRELRRSRRGGALRAPPVPRRARRGDRPGPAAGRCARRVGAERVSCSRAACGSSAGGRPRTTRRTCGCSRPRRCGSCSRASSTSS